MRFSVDRRIGKLTHDPFSCVTVATSFDQFSRSGQLRLRSATQTAAAQLVFAGKLGVQTVASLASKVDDGSFVSIAQVRTESNATLFLCDRKNAIKAET